MDMRLFPIEKPADGTAGILALQGDGPIVKGEDGQLNLLCGACDRILGEGMNSIRQLQQMVLLCQCGQHNATRA